MSQGAKTTYYLPKEVNGAIILEKVGSSKWLVTNQHLKAKSLGQAYRTEKHMDARAAFAPDWGTIIEGDDAGDEWVQTTYEAFEAGDFVKANSQYAKGVRAKDKDGNQDAWILAPEEEAQVVAVYAGGKFIARNPSGIESGVLRAGMFHKASIETPSLASSLSAPLLMPPDCPPPPATPGAAPPTPDTGDGECIYRVAQDNLKCVLKQPAAGQGCELLSHTQNFARAMPAKAAAATGLEADANFRRWHAELFRPHAVSMIHGAMPATAQVPDCPRQGAASPKIVAVDTILRPRPPLKGASPVSPIHSPSAHVKPGTLPVDLLRPRPPVRALPAPPPALGHRLPPTFSH
jgi:hypothetical protein